MEENVLVGGIFKYHRKRLSFKLEYLDYKTNISRTTISSFERGKQNLSNENIETLYSTMGMKYSHDENLIQWMNQRVFDMYARFIYQKNTSDIFNEIQSKELQIQTTIAFPVYLLGKLIYSYTNHIETDFKYLFSTIEQFEMYLSLEQQQIFNDIKGMYAFRYEKDKEKALKAYNKASNCISNPSVLALVFYHKSMVLCDMGKLHEAIYFIEEAKRIFDQQMNIERSILCNCELGIIYKNIRNYNKAEKILNQCINVLIEHPIEDEIYNVYYNLLWVFIESEQYQKIIDFKINEYIDRLGAYNFWLSFSYYQLGNIENAQKYINEAMLYVEDENVFMKELIDVFYTLLMEEADCELKEKKLNHLKQMTDQEINLNNQIFVNQLMIEYYESISDKDKIIYLLKEQVELYKKCC